MKFYTVHLGDWLHTQATQKRNNVDIKTMANTLGISKSAMHGRFAQADFKLNDLLALLDIMGASLTEVFLPEVKNLTPFVSVVADPAAKYSAVVSTNLKLERDLLSERLKDKDTLIAALQAQIKLLSSR